MFTPRHDEVASVPSIRLHTGTLLLYCAGGQEDQDQEQEQVVFGLAVQQQEQEAVLLERGRRAGEVFLRVRSDASLQVL